MNLEYCFENPNEYKKMFRENLYKLIELMQIVDGTIISSHLPPEKKSKSLYHITMDIIYETNNAYKKQFNIEKSSNEFNIMSEKEILFEMRNILKEEVAKAFSKDTDHE